ncbi:hypothetical protein [Capnocytophaga felis]|uniref:Lipoprotein n=1 Tax=Capnocytophaga felis TaxID=2267611 RepID=A0A5M4B9H4_9FLAO|nr:hypothetical protein [Capnocytophaga felis]GET46259.1 hypothetical protein RCZ01_15610 [Capnocytophaga felis]GET48202.1 hypothetical protein RCZ02_10330 [Capnocytophaga felis]
MQKVFLLLLLVGATLIGCQKESNDESQKPQAELSEGSESTSGQPKTPKTKIIYETVQIQAEQNFYLNSATHLGFGSKTRTVIPLEIPKNAVKVFYTVAVTEAKTPIKNLRLAAQLSSLLLDPTGITSAIASKIEVPEQGTSGRADFYLLDYKNQSKFLAKTDFQYFIIGSRESLKNGVIEISENTIRQIGNNLYIGVKNPCTTTGEMITFEAAAVIKKEITVYEQF